MDFGIFINCGIFKQGPLYKGQIHVLGKIVLIKEKLMTLAVQGELNTY